MELTFEDLAHELYTFRTETTGKGRDKVVTVRRGIKCGLGDLKEQDWIWKIECLITETGEWQIQENLREYVKDLPWINSRDKEAVRLKSLSLHSNRIFDNELWVDFVRFNQKYRPNVLDNTELVWVANDCCGKPALITKAQFNKPVHGENQQLLNRCPICGRWSTFRRVYPGAEDEMEKIQVSLMD